jgi:hypothetical protein
LEVIVENVIGGTFSSGQEEFLMNVWPSDTFAAIKEEVCKPLMISPEEVMLVHNGKPLNENLTVMKMGLREKSKIQLMLRFPGGA